MLEAKKYIISELNLNCKYIDIEFCLDRPMRTEVNLILNRQS